MAVQLFSYILSIIGLCGLILATISNEWKITGHDNDETVYQEKYEGLWMKCHADPTTYSIKCISYISIFHQSEIQAGRAVMLISIVLSTIAALGTISGLRCTRFLDGNEEVKNKVAFIGGILFMLSGLLAVAITGWFMYRIVQDFHEDDTREDRYVIGRALYGALAAALLSLIGGSLLCVCSITGLRPHKNISKHPISNSPGKDYV
ncbi:claudin-1 isoform X2 [Myxocyprinus asiaticus]|uniref:claudin-1 isoform X2 n=1 Tax=Myxocyprinus asiaticus TaxID=70543 RepID=UPI002222C399|nr:claudin-1 isoform X2 [Myxocyprinus asiaticus]